jgi:glycosyltransferase involved in cell wall biosynthesis
MTSTRPLRITHVVTYASEDGAFGGPLAVAIEQTRELAELGHDVELVMGWDGNLEVSVPGVTVRLFPVRRIPGTGFSGLFSRELQRHISDVATGRDIVHVHLGRDLVTAPAALRATKGRAMVFMQTHGMVMPDSRLRASLFDKVYISSALRRAAGILVLTPEEERGLGELVDGHAPIDRVTNGVTVGGAQGPSGSQEGNPVLDVLFLARLHPRKRVLTFARAAAIAAETLPSVRFSVVGPDEGDLGALKQFVSDNRLERTLFYEGPVAPGTAPLRIARSSVYVLPSVNEVVPMSVLEALAVGTPTIITRSNGLARTLEEHHAAVVIDESPEALAEAIRELAGSTSLRERLSIAGQQVIRSTFSAAAVARRLEQLYTTRR